MTDWFMERVCVQLKKNGANAVIRAIPGSQAMVEMEDRSTLLVRNDEISMVPPQEHDMVLVTGGADVGLEGELVCIDGKDAILKESNENFKIVILSTWQNLLMQLKVTTRSLRMTSPLIRIPTILRL